MLRLFCAIIASCRSSTPRLHFVGGMNLGREYAGKDPSIGGWRDIQLQLRGNVTAGLQDVFANDWYFASGKKIVEPEYYQRKGKQGTYLAQVPTRFDP